MKTNERRCSFVSAILALSAILGLSSCKCTTQQSVPGYGYDRNEAGTRSDDKRVVRLDR